MIAVPICRDFIANSGAILSSMWCSFWVAGACAGAGACVVLCGPYWCLCLCLWGGIADMLHPHCLCVTAVSDRSTVVPTDYAQLSSCLAI